MPLQEWVSLFKYFKVLVTTNIPVESDMLVKLMQSDEHVTPHKRQKIYHGIPPDKEDRDPESLREWLKVWFQHYTSWSDQMVEAVNNQKE